MKDLKITNGEITPQKFIGEKVSYDQAGQMIFGHKGDKLQLLLDVRGWGAIQHLFNTEKEAADFQDAVGEWYAEAINDKLHDKASELLKQRDELRDALKQIHRYWSRDTSPDDMEDALWTMLDIAEAAINRAEQVITKAEER